MEFQKGEVVEWIVNDQQHLVLKRDSDLVASLKKTPQDSVSAIFDRLWQQARPQTMQPRTRERARDLATGHLGTNKHVMLAKLQGGGLPPQQP